MFGDVYENGWMILIILVVGQTVSTIVGSPGVLMAMSKHQNALMSFGLLSGVIGIALSIMSVDAYGILGIAIGASVGKIIQNLLMWRYCYIKLGIKTNIAIRALSDIKLMLNK